MLGLGMKFIPQPSGMTILGMHAEFHSFARLLHLRAYFRLDGSTSHPSGTPLRKFYLKVIVLLQRLQALQTLL